MYQGPCQADGGTIKIIERHHEDLMGNLTPPPAPSSSTRQCRDFRDTREQQLVFQSDSSSAISCGSEGPARSTGLWCHRALKSPTITKVIWLQCNEYASRIRYGKVQQSDLLQHGNSPQGRAEWSCGELQCTEWKAIQARGP